MHSMFYCRNTESSTFGSFAWRQPANCLHTVHWLSANCLQTACPLLASWLKTDCHIGLWLAFTHRMFYCSNTVRPQLLRLLIKDCLMTASQLPEDCLPTACQLPADCLPTACQLTKDWLPIWFMAGFYAPHVLLQEHWKSFVTFWDLRLNTAWLLYHKTAWILFLSYYGRQP